MRNRIEEKTKESQLCFPTWARNSGCYLHNKASNAESQRGRSICTSVSLILKLLLIQRMAKGSLGKMLRSIGIGTRTVNIIEQLYDQTECSVVTNGHNSTMVQC